ncbi:MAG: YfcE family phosphodiesterase [Candidatus Heimdallarchaeota archaeon]|nr:YfcE family phosphodiesterase [Candidatus Heimdallarchaeota archaeon]
MISIGVIADTHIPDRAKNISPQIKEFFISNNVDLIIHAGDICVPRILKELEEIAPVEAVIGNLDFLFWFKFPLVKHLMIEDVKITVTQGHINFIKYFFSKIRYLFKGPRKFSYLQELALKKFPDADLIITGHQHIPVNKYINGQLLFNPGSTSSPNETIKNLKPSIGLIHIDGKQINAEIKYLNKI